MYEDENETEDQKVVASLQQKIFLLFVSDSQPRLHGNYLYVYQ